MMSALPLASARLRKLWIPFQNNLLDGALCKKIFISILSLFFLVFIHDLSDALIFFPYRSFKTQQVMTSHIRSHIEYFIQTSYIPMLIL